MVIFHFMQQPANEEEFELRNNVYIEKTKNVSRNTQDFLALRLRKIVNFTFTKHLIKMRNPN